MTVDVAIATSRRTRRPAEQPAAPVVRCAIYTRKSTDENLDSDFNSLDNQRQAAESYIRSQIAHGWTPLPDRYDDGGYSGATLERPALQRILANVRARAIDAVIVYRSDRLTRSLKDFTRLMELFQAHDVAFVSVTERFDTSTPAGRLQQHMLVSFHEYERELIAERVKDKMSAARKRGMYVGSIPPLGYHVKNKRLVVDEREAERVREIFDLYSQGLSPHEVAQEINRRGWRTKEWVSRKGNRFGGKPFDKYHLARILHNVTYVAKIEYEGEVYDGEHEAIVDEDLWRRVHAKLLERSVGHRIRQRSDATLRGLLRCKACAASMTPSFSTKGSRRYQYYRCVRANRRGAETCPSKSLPAAEIEGFVVDELAKYLKRRRLTDAVESLTNGQRSAVVRRWVEKVVYDGEKERIAITFREPEEIA